MCIRDRQVSVEYVDDYLAHNAEITHVAVVHCETTTGILNPLKEIAHMVKMHGKKLIGNTSSSTIITFFIIFHLRIRKNIFHNRHIPLFINMQTIFSVSYTHLDVYKRQVMAFAKCVLNFSSVIPMEFANRRQKEQSQPG